MAVKYKQWLPPALVPFLKLLLRRGVYFSRRYDSWEAASKLATGYDAEIILERVKRATLEVIAGRAAFERDSVLFKSAQHPFPVLAGLLRAAVESQGHLSVLDFGGSLGSSYFQCREFLSVLGTLAWSVVEQPHFVRAGRECIRGEGLRFYHSIRDVLTDHRPDVALLSSVLQYVPEPYSVLAEIIDAKIKYLIVDRTPFSDAPNDAISVQHVPASIYPASYPCWIFSKQTVVAYLSRHYGILTQFESNDGSAVAGGLRFAFGGMVLQRN